jgi:hypothetical protein
MKISLLKSRADFYDQMNNERDGVNACQRTAGAQCLDIIKEVEKIKGPYKQPEDNLDWLANDPASPYSAEIIALAKRSHGADMGIPKTVGNILEWADVLCATINLAVGYKASAYHEFTAERIAAEIDAGLPVMVSMKFPALKIPGHYVSVVGYEDRPENVGSSLGNADVRNVRYFIIADPYKNTLMNEPDGFCVPYSPRDWADHYKGYGVRFFKR